MTKQRARNAASLVISLVLVLVLVLGVGAAPAFADSTVFAKGLIGPIKLEVTERGNLLVTERGTGENDGRLSAVDRNGNVRALLSGLPSALEVTNQPAGPQGIVLDGCCVVELLIGEGNTLRFAASGPPAQMPNPLGPASPLFSSVLRVVFSEPIDALAGGFILTRLVHHETLADGFTVRLENEVGERAWVSLVADLKDFRPDPVTNVRGVNPFGLTAEHHGGSLLLTDGGQNAVVELGVLGPPKTLLRFARVQNPNGTMPPQSDAVPTGIRHLDGSRYLVTLFGGLPFAQGSASVRVVDVQKREQLVLIPNLTSAIDVLPLGGAIYVLEHSANVFAGQATGRLLRFARPSAEPKVIVSGLNMPTSVVYSWKQRAFFVTELGAGQIRRVTP